MKRIIQSLLGLGVLVGGAFLVYAWHPEIAKIEPPKPESFAAELVEKGRVLAGAGNCASCHTLKGGPDYAGGRGMHTPFGTLYVTNITPDVETGIGGWSEQAFARALRLGLARDGAHLFPGLPYTSYKNITDADVTALYAYFMTRKPVKMEEPKSTIPFPLNVRLFQAGWKLLFFAPTPMQSDPGKSAEWNRGAYLAEGLGHCTACHTPRNILGAEKTGAAHFSGALVDNWYAPSLKGKGDAALPWSANELYAYLRDGGSPLHGVAGGSMGHVIEGLNRLPDQDIRAMAVYFADLSGNPVDPSAQEVATLMARNGMLPASATAEEKRGEVIFKNSCAGCHYNPPGLPNVLRPELSLNSAVTGPDPTNLLRLTLEGVSIADGLKDAYMHGYAIGLSDANVAAVARYLRRTYGPANEEAHSAWNTLDKSVGALRAVGREHK